MRNILAICDSEVEYAYHLMEALGRRDDFPFEIQIFSSADKLCRHAAGTPIRLLLVAESDYTKEMEQLDTEEILILLDGEGPSGAGLSPPDVLPPDMRRQSVSPESEQADSSSFLEIRSREEPPGNERNSCRDTADAAGQGVLALHPYISKYSGVSAIARKVMEYARLQGSFGKMSQHPHPIRIIGIYTPIRRCLQTTFAFVTGQILARSHKVLYLNFETYSGLDRMLGRSFAAELTDLLYFLNGPKQQLLSRLYQMVENINGMDVCPPSFSGADISLLKEEEWLRFLEVLPESRYEYVILDLTDGIQGLYEILQRCSRIYTIVREDGFAMAKIAQYEEILSRLSCSDVLEKTRKCHLPVFRKLPRDLHHMTVGELAEYVERMLQEDEAGVL